VTTWEYPLLYVLSCLSFSFCFVGRCREGGSWFGIEVNEVGTWEAAGKGLEDVVDMVFLAGGNLDGQEQSRMM
jgi:hypothetical protein